MQTVDVMTAASLQWSRFVPPCPDDLYHISHVMISCHCPPTLPGVMSSSTYHVTVELSGGVTSTAAGPVGLRDGLRRVGPDQTSPVNQTCDTKRQRDAEMSQ